jgi:hypothetical protein
MGYDRRTYQVSVFRAQEKWLSLLVRLIMKLFKKKLVFYTDNQTFNTK